jgi:glycerophosphoryl diester phosphodiesterase
MSQPLVIGHRGAPGYRPEHTLASYELAVAQGADYIEPDLVITGDGVLVARHEPEISTTTDVADHPEFADRRTTKRLDGVPTTGWFTEDFTLAELKTLRARERIPDIRPRNTAYDGRFDIPTFQEVLDLRERLGVGIYPETKHPTYFRRLGLPLEEPLVAALRGNALDHRGAPVFLQSFEVDSLRRLRAAVDVPLVQLYGALKAPPYDLEAAGAPRTYEELATPEGLAWVAGHADAVGPPKGYILSRDGDGRPTSFVADAHRAGLLVHAWTFRAENAFLPLELRSSDDRAAYGDLAAEVHRFVDLGVDGVFTDNPDRVSGAG